MPWSSSLGLSGARVFLASLHSYTNITVSVRVRVWSRVRIRFRVRVRTRVRVRVRVRLRVRFRVRVRVRVQVRVRVKGQGPGLVLPLGSTWFPHCKPCFLSPLHTWPRISVSLIGYFVGLGLGFGLVDFVLVGCLVGWLVE